MEAGWFFQDCCETAGPANGAVCYFSFDGELQGVFRYKDLTPRTLASRGVWVHPSIRGLGIATQMVEFAMQNLGKTTFQGYSVTQDGLSFLKGLKETANFRVIDRNPDA